MRGTRDSLRGVDARLPAEQLASLLHRRPAALRTELAGGQGLQLERIWLLAAGRPGDAGDLGHGQLLRGGDVEVLVRAGRRAKRGDDALGGVIDVRGRPPL